MSWAGVPPDSSGSAAGLRVELTNSQFLRNGYSVSDRDGIRINDGAGGNLVFVARGVRTGDNAGDGSSSTSAAAATSRRTCVTSPSAGTASSTRPTSTMDSISTRWTTAASWRHSNSSWRAATTRTDWTSPRPAPGDLTAENPRVEVERQPWPRAAGGPGAAGRLAHCCWSGWSSMGTGVGRPLGGM